MARREIVYMVFEEGYSGRIPLHFESIEKSWEARLSDILLGHAWVPLWSDFFSEKGGPFARLNRKLSEWANNLDIESYDWPSIDQVVSETLEVFRQNILEYIGDHFIIFEVIGPTEQSEYFMMPPQEKSRDIELFWHEFDFGKLYRVNPREARKLYSKLCRYIIELVKAGCEFSWVDAIRVADDAASYMGLIYSWSFYEDLYLPFHREVTDLIHRMGKLAILHADGDIRPRGLLKKLSELYDGIHPLDLAPRSTLKDAYQWAIEVGKVRKYGLLNNVVALTGLPIELIMLEDITPHELATFTKFFIDKHGYRRLILSVTHRPYPGRSFSEPCVLEKINAVTNVINVLSGES